MDLSIALCFVFYVWFTCCLLLLFLPFAIYGLEFFAILPLTSRWSCYDSLPVEPNFPHLLRLEQKDFQDSALHHMKRLGIKALEHCFSLRVGKVKTRFLITLRTFSLLKNAKAVVDKTSATRVWTKAMAPGTHKALLPRPGASTMLSQGKALCKCLGCDWTCCFLHGTPFWVGTTVDKLEPTKAWQIFCQKWTEGAYHFKENDDSVRFQ